MGNEKVLSCLSSTYMYRQNYPVKWQKLQTAGLKRQNSESDPNTVEPDKTLFDYSLWRNTW